MSTNYKIVLMYLSEYGFVALPEAWVKPLMKYDENLSNGVPIKKLVI